MTDRKSTSESHAAYNSSWEHLSDELRRLDLLIRVRRLRHLVIQPGTNLDKFKGIVISEEEIAGLLADDSPDIESPEIEAAEKELEGLILRIEQRRAESVKVGTVLLLPQLSAIFGLTPFEQDCVLVCFAPEVKRKYERLYAYLQDDIHRKKPTIDLLLRLLCATENERFGAYEKFQPNGRLVKYRLLEITDNSDDGRIPLLSRSLKLDDRIVSYLLGGTDIDNRLKGAASLAGSPDDAHPILVDAELKTRLIASVHSYLTESQPDAKRLIAHLHGPYGSGKHLLVNEVAAEIGIPLVTIDLAKVLNGKLPFEEAVWLLGREARLQSAAVSFRNFDRLTVDEEQYRPQLNALVNTIENFVQVTFLLGTQPWTHRGILDGHIFIDLELAAPAADVRKRLWESHASDYNLAADIDFGPLASKFRFTPGQIQDALIAAENQSRWRLPGQSSINSDDLHTACRAQSDPKLQTLTQKIEPRYTWDDIVLPNDTMAQLREMCQRVELRDRVLGEWGFGDRLALGKGVVALFTGPPGTGKTMAAEVIANECNLDLFKIDLSRVLSKWIGEFEQNIERIFKAAQHANAILCFDEADALFSKRTEVHQALDVHANTQIAHLLQKMDEYEGVAILTTNLRQNIDEAFIRRIPFVIQCPFPDEAERRRIWQKIWPARTPLASDIDLDFLATLKMCGGNIRNIAHGSAYLACAQDSEVTMEHLFHATRREYQNMGKVPPDFVASGLMEARAA
jgi:adenylate kinase family enzyme